MSPATCESRFRDFLTTDGEKPDRDRDAEFEMPRAARRGPSSSARGHAGWRRCWRDRRALARRPRSDRHHPRRSVSRRRSAEPRRSRTRRITSGRSRFSRSTSRDRDGRRSACRRDSPTSPARSSRGLPTVIRAATWTRRHEAEDSTNACSGGKGRNSGIFGLGFVVSGRGPTSRIERYVASTFAAMIMRCTSDVP